MKTTICDKCGSKENVYKGMAQIKHTFGFGTIYEGKSIELDICEQCFIELFEDQL